MTTVAASRRRGVMAWVPRVGLGVAVVLALGYLFFRGGGDVSGSDARRLVERGALLVDVRTPEEFAAGHIAGAVNIPLGQLDDRMDELGPRDAPLVLYCRSGNRSGQAARVLASAGFTGVHDLGAMSRW